MRRLDVRIWMLRNDVSVAQVARDLDVYPSIVSRWLDGKKSSSRVERWFLDHGCPARVIERREQAA
ncbi:hypothetical protein [Desulfonatronovibrio hydrogenovorans]|uniref:hypothetical protein n=1 Tax=Desulfonatronovibrio hydrogenovorans TaxID=53245 RepID=UPI00048E8293|nr:hypothetical protein [Desulfonatronovibrio hydrogenovorans]